MTPTDILAAARLSPLSPVVPAREEWIAGWRGPAEFLFASFGWHPGVVYAMTSTGHVHGVIWSAAGPSLDSAVFHLDNVRLDLRRPEVRDRLVRCGAPEWCRDSVAGMLAWVVGGKASGLGMSWVHAPVDTLWTWRRPEPGRAGPIVSVGDHGWSVFHLRGPETGPEGRACADLAALRAGCILEEPDGWYIPLPGGAVGWLPKENA